MKTIPQRPLNTAYSAAKPVGSLSVGNLPPAPMRSRSSGEGMARNINEKHIPDAPISPGMTRQTSGELHPFLHGQSVNDEPNVPYMSHEKPIPIHNGIAKHQHDKFNSNAANSAALILSDAANLGKPPRQ